MEIGTYLRVILRYWWLVLLVTIVSGLSAALLGIVRAPVYTTQVRVAARPSAVLTDTLDIVNLVGQIGSRAVVGTFAQMFTSSEVIITARAAAGVEPEEVGDYTIEATVIPDSSVIEVTGTGAEARKLAQYVNATVDATVNSTNDLFTVMNLEPLETAPIPDRPTSPQPARDILLGTALGLALGILLVLALDYFRGNEYQQVGEGAPVQPLPQRQPTPLVRTDRR